MHLCFAIKHKISPAALEANRMLDGTPCITPGVMCQTDNFICKQVHEEQVQY